MSPRAPQPPLVDRTPSSRTHTRRDLARGVAALGLPLPMADALVQTVLEAIADTLQRGQAVSLSRLGRFDAVARASRVGWDPVTQQRQTLPGDVRVRFRPASTLRDDVNRAHSRYSDHEDATE